MITTDDDAWAFRLASFAALAQIDAMAIVAEAPVRVVRAHNVTSRVAIDATLGSVIEESQRTGGVVQLAARVRLDDGRTSDSAIVAPVAAVQGVSGYLVGLRVGRGFGSLDGHAMISVAEVIAVDLQRQGAAEEDAVARRQSLALYELSRHALSADDAGASLQNIAELLVSSLGHDIAQLWLLRGGGSLALRAAQPREGLALEIARPRDHSVLARALAGDVVRANDPSLRSWVSRTTRDLIVAPLAGANSVGGVLVVGRWRGGYESDDEAMAAECGRFLGRALFAGRTPAAEAPETSSEAEAELTGS